jgi:hypoxanthine phosphoribosyltransferase
VERIAQEISRDYHGEELLMLGILKGSFVFMADLVRLLDIPLEIEFVRLSSYGAARESSGNVRVVQGIKTPIKGRNVMVTEDIVDTGLTINFFLDYLRRKKPASLRLCALFNKPSRRKLPVTIDYLGLTVPDEFLVGYGLDWKEKFRYLPDLYILEEEFTQNE